EGGLADTPVRADQPQVEEQCLVDGDLARLLVDEVKALAGPVEDRAEIRSDRRDEALRLADRGRQVTLAADVPLTRECVRRNDLDAERPEHERQDVGRGREAVVDDYPEAARTHRLGVNRARG